MKDITALPPHATPERLKQMEEMVAQVQAEYGEDFDGEAIQEIAALRIVSQEQKAEIEAHIKNVSALKQRQEYLLQNDKHKDGQIEAYKATIDVLVAELKNN